MAVRKRIVCLANSRKLNGRCIAGREVVEDRTGPWIRPVSDRDHQEVSEYERQYQDGSDPQVLDIVDVPLTEPRPDGHQQENWLLDPEQYWVRSGRFPFSDLAKLADGTGNLWVNGHHTYNGRNDQIPVDQAAETDSSLKLVRVDGLQLKVFAPGQAFEKGGYPSECSPGSIGGWRVLGVGVNIRARTRRCARGFRTIERASTTSTGCVGQPDSSARIAVSRARGFYPMGVARVPAVADGCR